MQRSQFSIYDMIARNARCYGERPAWQESRDAATRTFAQIKAAVDTLAAGLQDLGIAKGDRIGVVAPNRLEFFLLYGAAAALGAIVLPINWRLSPEEVGTNLKDGTPRIVFADPAYLETVESIQEKLDTVSAYIVFGEAQGPWRSFAAIQGRAEDLRPAQIDPDDGFVIIHTAAVAGRPRGAVVTHGNLLWANLQFASLMDIKATDVHLSLLPLFHVAGLFMAMACYHAGALSINMAKFDAPKAVELIAERNVTLMFEFMPILNGILEAQAASGKSLASLRAVTGLDTPETIEKYQQATGGTFYVLYGQTETACIATFGPYNDCPGSAGRPVPMATVQLLDEDDQVVPDGQTGEIAVRGPMVFKGYWNLPDDNARTFREGWHHTGDLGRFDEQGYLWYAGRKPEKELIKPGGENVYPEEVERVIRQHPAVKATVVIGVPDPKWKEGIKAVCVLQPQAQLSARELIEFVGGRIARFKKPGYVEFIEKLPAKEDGSIDREAVKAQYGGEQSG